MTKTRGSQRFPLGAVSRKMLAVVGGLVALAFGVASTQTCLRVGFTRGVWLDQCPDGDVHQVISMESGGLTRGAQGFVYLRATAVYTTDRADSAHHKPITRFTPELALLSGTKVVATLVPKDGWKRAGTQLVGEVSLPQVNDGEYALKATVTSPLETSVLEVKLPLYTPARVHVLTDRPLYEPGNTVKFRAVALKANDLTPLDERPGTWLVQDPSGEVLLEEKAPAGPWGVVAGSFPLDQGAQSGEWSVSWSSGGTTEVRHFTVKPFTLPRFRIEASTSKPFYRRGERPVMRGTVRYSSGAPVPNAKVEASWHVGGAWPPPTAWVDGSALPKLATTSAAGAFTLELPAVPEDLAGQATVSAALSAVDTSGDRVEGGASVLLSEDPIAVTAVTELDQGLVEGMNNRVFLRATSADGRVLDGVTLHVKRLWEETDPGTDATVDEDGVASLQVDPGPPVNVIIPALPFRPPPPTKPVERSELSDLLASEESDGDVALADRLAFDRLDAKLGPCARYAHSAGEAVHVGLLVAASGAQGPLAAPAGKLGECVAAVVRTASFAPGHERFFQADWTFDDSDLPKLTLSTQGSPSVPPDLDAVLADAALSARDCLPASVRSGDLPRLLEWRAEGAKLDTSWVPVKGAAYPAAAVDCITSRIKGLRLPKPQAEDDAEAKAVSVGVAHVAVVAPPKYERQRPQDTVMTGYEFLVSARKGKELFGATKLRVRPGVVPPIRLRASAQLVRPGDSVTVEVLRGPDFTGELPEKLFLMHAYASLEAKVDKETRSATFVVPKDWQGWAQVEWGGGKVFLFVRSTTPLALEVKPEKPRYTPGQVAQLELSTRIGDAPGPAAVGLFGVDDSLSQLVPLPGADELAGLRPQPTGVVAFAGVDAQALSLGRVRGANAAAATLLRVGALPPPPQLEAAVRLSGATTLDPNAVLVDRFYVVLAELADQVRRWEGSAPATEKMSNATMAKLWGASLDAVEAKKDSARDLWGRKLRLHRLPPDLLALTEPRSLVINGTRLPEDMQNWAQWVAKERP